MKNPVTQDVLDELAKILERDAYFSQRMPNNGPAIIGRESGIYAGDDGFKLVYQLVGPSDSVHVVDIRQSRALPGEKIVFLNEEGPEWITLMAVSALALPAYRRRYEERLAQAARFRLRMDQPDSFRRSIEYIAESEGLTRIGP